MISAIRIKKPKTFKFASKKVTVKNGRAIHWFSHKAVSIKKIK